MDFCQSDHLVKNLVFNIDQYLSERNWTIRVLSEKSDIPYESLKKLVNGKISNPSICSLVKLSNAFECSIDSLISEPNDGWKNVLEDDQRSATTSYTDIFDLHVLPHLPKRSIQLLNAIAQFELQLTRRSLSEKQHYISVIVPTSHVKDGMLFDSCYLETINIASYGEEYKNLAICGLKITNKSFHPAYLQDDILLIARDRHPSYGETGVFLFDNKAYLRKYIYGTPSQLLPVNGVGLPIVAETLEDWYVFGRVLTVIRMSE